MGADTSIEWADHTWNPWWGCTAVSVGDKGACEFCYAEKLAARFGVQWGPHAERRKAGPKHLALPHAWERRAQKDGTRPFVFCASMADIFDNQVPAEWRREAFDVMRACPSLVWLLLTKRPSMIVKLSAEAGGLPPNAALGASMVTQAELDRDWPHLATAAYELGALFSFISAEPLMEALDLRLGQLRMLPAGLPTSPDWVIAGGESGPKARPSHPDWFRSLRDQCAAAGVPFLFKQWGEWLPYRGSMLSAPRIPRTGVHAWPEADPEKLPAPLFELTSLRVGKKAAGRSLDGVEHNGFPAGFGKEEKAAA